MIMNWYYSKMGVQVGPISDKEFQAMVNEGKIQSYTRVWNSTMTDWQEYGQIEGSKPVAPPNEARAADSQGEASCSECGRISSQEEMIRYGDAWVCAGCKPIFVQKLKEGVTVAGTMEYAGFWIRFGAKFIDGLIIGVVNMAVSLVLGFTMATSSDPSQAYMIVVISNLLQIAIAAAYTTWLLGRYGATLGKMACKIKVVTPDGGSVSYARALGRYFAEILSAMIFSIGYIMAAFDDQKRTLHDRICNTRVVKT